MPVEINGKDMKFDVSEELVKKTTKCLKKFACLHGEEDCLCAIKDCVGSQIHFIKFEDHSDICIYKMGFGYSYFCNCPIRKELYNQYNV